MIPQGRVPLLWAKAMCCVKAGTRKSSSSQATMGRGRERGSRLADVREAGVECRACRKNGVIPGHTCASESRCLMPISDVC